MKPPKNPLFRLKMGLKFSTIFGSQKNKFFLGKVVCKLQKSNIGVLSKCKRVKSSLLLRVKTISLKKSEFHSNKS